MVTRVAILGCGSVARGHVTGWREAGADVVLAVDADEPRARAFAHEVEIEETAGAWDAALDRKDITIVDICLPHALHAPAAIAAAQAGKHVFVEKPIATTLEEADRMIAAAEHTAVLLMVRHNHRFMPVRRSAKRIIENGGIGEPYLLRSTCIASPEYILARPWYGQTQQGHGGVLLGNAIHHLDLFRWYAGEVCRLAALGTNKVIGPRAGMDAEDTVLLVCEFVGGALGELLFTDAEVTDRAGLEQVEVYGTEGWLAVSFNRDNYGVSSRIFGDGDVHALPPAQGLDAETDFAHFLRCMASGDVPLTSGPEARKALELVIAGYQSMRSGGFVTLPIDPDLT